MAKKITRGINNDFSESFRASPLFELYTEHEAELFLAVRNDYMNIYYMASSISKVTVNRQGELQCKVANKYIGVEPCKSGNRVPAYSILCPEEIVAKYEVIKRNIESRAPAEKIAQQALAYRNNANKNANWVCIDIEYAKQRNNNGEDVFGRFDIIAVSKAAPHRVALIELKYYKGAIGGKSGIRKHAEDFRLFRAHDIFTSHMKKEIKAIATSLGRILEDDFLSNIKTDSICDVPEFYFITLDNNRRGVECTPKQTMAGYVFEAHNPKSRDNQAMRVSTQTVERALGDITNPENPHLYARFLFSQDTIESMKIDDIIDDESYDRDF